jgi:hypothetical protein
MRERPEDEESETEWRDREMRRSESRVGVLPFMKVRSIHDNF